MIGSDYRAGDAAGGSRSDTLMLVRIDPRTKYISLLSLPRDLYVTIPGYGVDKINAAYSDGGYKLALKTVEDATGVKPNYLVTVDFKGFRDLVDKFHGVYVPVDQRYYHVNVAGQEQYSQVDIPPGYQLLNGTNALAFARYRHTDSDFYRNARQQVFLHAFSQRASSQLHGIGLDQLTTLRDVAETIAKNVQVTGPNGPPSVQTMIELATTAYAIKDRVITSRLNATVAGDAINSYVEATPEAMRSAVFAFTHPESMRPPTNTLPGKATNGPKVPKFKPKVDPTTTPLTTVNGNGTHRRGRQRRRGAGDVGLPRDGLAEPRRRRSPSARASSTTGPATSRLPQTWPTSWAAPWRSRSPPPTRHMPRTAWSWCWARASPASSPTKRPRAPTACRRT